MTRTSNLKRKRTENHGKLMSMTRSLWQAHLAKCEVCRRFYQQPIHGKT